LWAANLKPASVATNSCVQKHVGVPKNFVEFRRLSSVDAASF
jgi:hypothetical protein